MHLSIIGLKQLLCACIGILTAALLVIGFISPAQAAPTATTPTAVSISTAVSKACPTAVKSRPNLRQGATGACVKVLQQLLISKGYTVGAAKADGIFGKLTNGAVLQFQRDNRLKPDGLVGQITWAALTSKSSATPNTAGKAPAILTFDDCPVSKRSANATLKAAHGLKMHLRIYVTGNCLKQGKFDVSYARKMGHTVCSHSNTHAYLPGLSLSGIRKEMTVAGLKTNCARPPYGAVNANVKKVFKEKGLRLDLWSVDTNDWQGKSQSQVVNYVIANTQHGSVVLMHLQWNGFNAKALTAMKTGLNKRGIAVK